MFILRNKETKKFPFGFEERDFPLTTGENLHNSLYGYYYGDQKALEKIFIEKEIDQYQDHQLNYFDPEKYEIVEFEIPEPFYVRESIYGRTFEIVDGYGKIFFNTNLGMEPVYTDEDEYIYDQKTGEHLELPAYRQHFILELIHGRAYISWFANTEEGHSYSEESIELVYNEEGFPYWEITNESGGSDCDGPIERTSHYISNGGFNKKSTMQCNFGKDYTEEKYEQELKFHSPCTSNSNKRGSQRDYFAEQAGY